MLRKLNYPRPSTLCTLFRILRRHAHYIHLPRPALSLSLCAARQMAWKNYCPCYANSSWHQQNPFGIWEICRQTHLRLPENNKSIPASLMFCIVAWMIENQFLLELRLRARAYVDNKGKYYVHVKACREKCLLKAERKIMSQFHRQFSFIQ